LRVLAEKGPKALPGLSSNPKRNAKDKEHQRRGSETQSAGGKEGKGNKKM